MEPSEPKVVYSLKELGVAEGFARRSSHLDRNFITSMRAEQDFLLKPEDLRGLRVTTRRSPHEVDPPLNVYWRKDVEAKSLEVWGSKEALEKELELRAQQETQREEFKQSIVKRFMESRR